MSVTFHLYKVNKDVHFLGSKYDFATKDEKEKVEYLMNHSSMITKEDDSWFDEFLKERYSDNKKHETIEVTWYKSMSKLGSRYKGYYPLYKKLQSFNQDTLYMTHGFVNKYIVVDEIVYRQGWFLKKNFFKKGTTSYIATNKKELKSFFSKYLDSQDERGIEAYNTFMKEWKDDMIFVVSW